MCLIILNLNDMCGMVETHKNKAALRRLGIEDNLLTLKSNIYQKPRAKVIFMLRELKLS